ncbi:MAG: hypothetical protein KJ645_13500 [Planctomycetes bacterium]|nr:hypothetical protein [Planctomycetota bacterium]
MIILWTILSVFLIQTQDPPALRVIAAADLPGWQVSGAARIEHPAFQKGNLVDLFDRDPGTLIRCSKKGRAVFSFSFGQPFTLRQVGITPGGGGIYRWLVEVPEETGSPEAAFTPLFDWRYVVSGQRDPLPLPQHFVFPAFRVVVERLTLGEEVVLHELECYTPLEIVAIEVENCPQQLQVGIPFQPGPVAVDRFGGRFPLDENVQLNLYPPGLIKHENGQLTPLTPGKVRLSYSLAGLSSEEHLLNIRPSGSPPSGLQVELFETTAVLRLGNETPRYPAYAAYVRPDGTPPPQRPVLITEQREITVTALQPEKVYYFSIAGMDDAANPITARSEEVRQRMPLKETLPLCRTARFDVLVPCYTQGFQPGELEAILIGFDEAREFIFRSSLARFDLALHVVRLQGEAPVEPGGGMEAIEKDLVRRGLLARNNPAIHVVAKNLVMNQSGYRFQNNAIGSQGFSADMPRPDRGSPVERKACWTLLHEIQHTLERIISETEGCPPILCGHFLDNYPLPPGEVFDAGSGYAGQREIFRIYTAYLEPSLKAFRICETLDRDQDGLPDQDGRLPIDEMRFGSDPQKQDTDEDGLTDLEELCAGLYQSSNPLAPDTDNDGIRDGEDPFPLSGFTGCIPFGTTRRGDLPAGLLSEELYFIQEHRPLRIAVYASWDFQFLYLAFRCEKAFRFLIHLDGSGHLGPFESDKKVSAAPGVPNTGTKAGSDVYTKEAVLSVAFGSPALLCGTHAVPGAEVFSAEGEEWTLLWTAIPANLGPGTVYCHIQDSAKESLGLTLEEGRILGFSITAVPLNSSQESGGIQEFGEDWCSLFEMHAFYDALLLPLK